MNQCGRLRTNLLAISEPRKLVVGPVVRWPDIDGHGHALEGGAAALGSHGAHVKHARLGLIAHRPSLPWCPSADAPYPRRFRGHVLPEFGRMGLGAY